MGGFIKSRYKIIIVFIAALTLIWGGLFSSINAEGALLPLKNSKNGRYIIQEDGTPIFWLADDGWGLHNRTNAGDANFYLATRKAQGFTVIHTWMVSKWMPENLHGDGPFQGSIYNASTINVNQSFFDNIGHKIDLAASKGLYVVLEIGHGLRNGPFSICLGNNPTNQGAYQYGWKIANALKKDGAQRPNIIWGLGIDTSPVSSKSLVSESRNVELVRIIAEGVADANNGLPLSSLNGQADYSTTLISYHPQYPHSTSEWFGDDAWLDYNSHQSGRDARLNPLYHTLITTEYDMMPVKPCIEAEAGYEGGQGNLPSGQFTPYNQRVEAYWSLFAGGFGFQYGHSSTWQFYVPVLFSPRAGATIDWHTAINAEGANDMIHVRNLMESRPLLIRIPDQSILASSEESGGPHTRLQATRDSDGCYAFVYATNGRNFDIHMGTISGKLAAAWWYDPRTGNATFIGNFPTTGTQTFDPPRSPSTSETNGNDWILVLDDVSQGFGRPGIPMAQPNDDETVPSPPSTQLNKIAIDPTEADF